MEIRRPDIPKWANRLLTWFCAPDLLEEIEGDLYESFVRNTRELGLRRARRQFIWDVLRFFTPATIRGQKKRKSPNFNMDMLLNQFRFTLRRFAKQKVNTGLHITGLTIGLTVCLLIGLFIRHELSFDNYHPNADRIYRVNQIWEESGVKHVYYDAPGPLAEALRTGIPEVEYAAMAYPLDQRVIEINGRQRFKQEHILMADPDLLNILDFRVLQGNGHQALGQPNQALLTASTAEKFFGREDPMGKTFLFDNAVTVTVAGIIADPPKNTHLRASMLMSNFPHERWLKNNMGSWGMSYGASVFALLKPGTDPQSLLPRIRAMYDLHINEGNESPEIGYAVLQPLFRIHLEPDINGGGMWQNAINPQWLWFFGGIGILVLLLACINFVNLSTAQALTRAREVGIRKAIGADRGQLVVHFLGEAFLLIGISSALAVLVTGLTLPLINRLIDKSIDMDLLYAPGGMLAFLAFISATGLLTGIYPAWLIARFQPAAAIKSRFSTSDHASGFLRKGLVITQFTISTALLIALLIMSRQMDYVHRKHLGFDKENIITVYMPDKAKNGVFKAALEAIPQVGDVAFSMGSPASDGTWTTNMHETNLNDPNRKNVRIIWADENYARLYKLQLLAGRLTEDKDTNFISQAIPEAERSPRVLVNEKLVHEMGFGTPEQALHRRFYTGYNNYRVEIVGVVKDFNISSLHTDIKPLMMSPFPEHETEASIKLKPGDDLPAALATVQATWEKLFPDHLYESRFLEQAIEHYYESESRLYGLFKIFAGLAILISCLGLWGLATFAAVQRTKEVGIRKVFGATTGGLVALLSRDFLFLVGIALLVAAPIAWYGMHEWLQNFSYRIDIHWSVFAIAAVSVLAIAFLTVGFQSVKSALANPVKSLRNE